MHILIVTPLPQVLTSRMVLRFFAEEPEHVGNQIAYSGAEPPRLARASSDVEHTATRLGLVSPPTASDHVNTLACVRRPVLIVANGFAKDISELIGAVPLHIASPGLRFSHKVECTRRVTGVNYNAQY